MKKFVILGLLVGLLAGGCATPRGHNFYRVDGYLGSSGFSSTEIVFHNKVRGSIARLSWGVVPLCVVLGGPLNKAGLSYGEKFSFQYNVPPYPYYGGNGISLSVEFMNEAESRYLNSGIISEIFPVFYGPGGTYNWNFWDEGGQIRWQIQSSGYSGGFGGFGYR